jgi:catenin beta 1
MEAIASYAITTLHNVLLDCGDKVKMQMRKLGAVHQIVPLLASSQNVKFLSIVVDCLQLLAFGNQESKQVILEMGGTQTLIAILANHGQYQKLLLNTTRLLKVLSVCGQNKAAMIAMNAMQTLAMHIVPQQPQDRVHVSHDAVQNCLITLRNLSDAATRLNGLEQLVQNLVHVLDSTTDFTLTTLTAGILSNLTCNNESNKRAAMRASGVQVLLRKVHQSLASPKPQLVDPCLCALRHITNRHSEMLLAHEQIRSLNGLRVLTEYMSILPRSWPCTKALLGLIRNLCSNQLNAGQLRANSIIEKLMQVLYDANGECHTRTNNGASIPASLVIKVDDVNLLDIVDASASALLILAKEQQNQMIMKYLDCIGFFVQMFFSPIVNCQRAAVSLLAELATNPECARVIDEQVGLHQFVQAQFCNEYGMIKAIGELDAGASANASIVLQHVTTLMQRLHEHRNQQFLMMQQQQQLKLKQQEQLSAHNYYYPTNENFY